MCARFSDFFKNIKIFFKKIRKFSKKLWKKNAKCVILYMYNYIGVTMSFYEVPVFSEVDMAKFDIEIERACAFCEYATPAPSDKDGNEFVICAKKGLVKEGRACRKFSYDPLKREPTKRPPLPEVDIVDIEDL